MLSFFKNLSFQAKLLSVVLIASVLSLLLTGFISYTSSRGTLTETGYNQLTGLRNARAQAINQYFDTLDRQVLTTSESVLVIEAIKAFKPAFAALNNEKLTPTQVQELKNYYKEVFVPTLRQRIGGNPQVATYFPTEPADQYTSYWYTAKNPFPDNPQLLNDPKDGSEYSKVNSKFNARIAMIAKAFNYYDIYLVDVETSDILYSLRKEVDLCSNLEKSVFAGSGLAKAFNAVKASRDPSFATAIDFEDYRPSYGRPSSFIGTTVFEGEKFVGALIFQIVPDKIDQIMNANLEWEKVGLGKSGETYLIGQDNLLRSNTRLFKTDPDKYYKTLADRGVRPETIDLIKSSGTSILRQKIVDDAVTNTVNGKSGTLVFDDYRGVPSLGSYQPIKLGDFEWGLIAKMDQAELFKGVSDLTRRLLVMVAILIPVLTMLSIWLARRFLAPIRRLITATHQVEEGQLDTFVKVDSQDEFGQLGKAFNKMTQALKGKEEVIQSQLSENNRLLLSMLPPKAAQRMKDGERDIVENFPQVTLLYAEIEGFNTLAAQISPEKAIFYLNDLVGAFDAAAEKYGVEKLQSNGAIYLAVCGLSVPRVDHTKRVVDYALELLTIIRKFSQRQGQDLSLDIGIHSGAVAAGVVGKDRFNYALWGETMNITRTIHESPDQNVIQVTKMVFDGLQGMYNFEPAEPIPMKGKGKLPIWTVKPLSSDLLLDDVED